MEEAEGVNERVALCAYMPPPVMMEEKKITLAVLSKKRFNQIKEAVMEAVKDETITEQIMKRVSEIMKFDPDVGIYRKGVAKMMYDKQKQKAAEQNMSVYKALKMDEYYKKNKEVLNKKKTEYMRQRRAKEAVDSINKLSITD
jgi:hypothetical protein